jgi:hypothetical protein
VVARSSPSDNSKAKGPTCQDMRKALYQNRKLKESLVFFHNLNKLLINKIFILDKE